ncbi:MAG TPA: hypothetical protein VJZ76_06255 [Thermoanaerobaculia bacterium]|nr:hypothetical protein [Thermoanaerobaculia bacterium]
MPDKHIAFGLFVLAAVTFAYFYGGAGWNQDAQFDLTRALVERHTLYIDGYENTGDVSVGVGGHKYVNRAPGVSFLAAVPYVFVRNQWFCTAATCGLCGALIDPILYLYGRRRYNAQPRDAVWIALAIVFGTIVFAYSTMLFVHVPAALFLLLAVVWLDDHPFAAGAAAGMATLCFYVCGAAALLLAIVRRDRRVLLGGAPFAVLLGLYHWACFGSPFRTAVESSTQWTERGLLFGVLRLPRLDALLGITVSPYRGLFFASPFLIFGIAALFVRGRAIIAGITAVFLIVIAGFNGWNGGWAFGPRYLTPIIPLLGIAMLAAARNAPRVVRALWLAAALVSIAINFVATAVDAMPSDALPNPIVRYQFPAFLRGRIPEETRRAFPWYASQTVDKVALPRDAHNLGERIFGEGKRASVVPIALWLVAGSAGLITLAREPSPRQSPPPRTP